jgi:hypothetical protein
MYRNPQDIVKTIERLCEKQCFLESCVRDLEEHGNVNSAAHYRRRIAGVKSAITRYGRML